jgi:hypothetical protein
MKPKTLITLKELEVLYAKFQEEQTGKIVRPQHPIELSPGWNSYCKQHWTAFEQGRQRREYQLVELDMIETHEIDYYKNTPPIVPF